MIRAALIFALLATTGLAACGPTSPQRAFEQCSDRARLAAGPRGTVSAGISNTGPVGGLSVAISSDYLRGADPYTVYDTCFRNLTGAGPTRPLVL